MVTVTFSFNQNYLNYAKVLVNSIKINSPDTNIVVRAVNVSEDALKESWCQNIHTIIDKTALLTKKTKIKCLKDNQTSFWNGNIPKRNLLYSEEIAYTCHSRFLNILYLLENGIDNIFCIDVDFIIRKNLSALINLKEDIHIMHKVEGNNTLFTDEDAILLKNTPQTRAFIEEVNKRVMQGADFWDIDTIALNEVYELYKNAINLHQLSISYKDYNLNADSIVWSGDGGAKFNTKFIEESKLYQ
jgi:hypothetical protein